MSCSVRLQLTDLIRGVLVNQQCPGQSTVKYFKSQNQCFRTVQLLKFIGGYKSGNRYRTDDLLVTYDIIMRFLKYTLKEFILQKTEIEASALKGYTKATN